MSFAAVKMLAHRTHRAPWQREGLWRFLKWCAQRAGPKYQNFLHDSSHETRLVITDGDKPAERGDTKGHVLGITRPMYRRNRRRLSNDQRPRFTIHVLRRALRDPVLLAEVWIHELRHALDFWEYVYVAHGPQDAEGYSWNFPNSAYYKRNMHPYPTAMLEVRAEVAANRFLALTPDTEIIRAFKESMDSAAREAGVLP